MYFSCNNIKFIQLVSHNSEYKFDFPGPAALPVRLLTPYGLDGFVLSPNAFVLLKPDFALYTVSMTSLFRSCSAPLILPAPSKLH